MDEASCSMHNFAPGRARADGTIYEANGIFLAPNNPLTRLFRTSIPISAAKVHVPVGHLQRDFPVGRALRGKACLVKTHATNNLATRLGKR